jgi:hypothetical protein
MNLPPDDTLRWIARSYARLLAAHGEAFRRPQLVQPNGDFFPDTFRPDGPSVARMLSRMLAYSPLSDDLSVELAFVETSTQGTQRSGCGSLACESAGDDDGSLHRLVDELDGGYRVFVSVHHLADADVLGASLARAIGRLVLLEGGGYEGEDLLEQGEIAAVACGFGVLLANGAAVWAKSCGGLRMAKATRLSVEEITIALALFLGVGGEPPSAARAYMPATQREALDSALAWMESNHLLVETLRDHPDFLVRGTIDLEPARGPLGRWLHRRKIEREMRPVVAVAPASAERQRRLEEARALVDEVLGDSPGE